MLLHFLTLLFCCVLAACCMLLLLPTLVFLATPRLQGPSHDGSIAVFPLAYKLLPELLRTGANYRTYMIGKWHLGYATPQHVPEVRTSTHRQF